jgi:hypothetical protein
LFAKRRLLRITYCGQFPNQTEKLSGTDTSRNSAAFFQLGYGFLTDAANNLGKSGMGRLSASPFQAFRFLNFELKQQRE